MATLLCVSIALIFILDNSGYVNSQTTTLSPTKEPTTEPTTEPTLEPTMHPLFTQLSTTINPFIPSPTVLDIPSTDTSTFIEENYLWLIIGGSALLCICCVIIVFILRNKQTSKLESELKKTNQAIKNESLKEESKPMNVRTSEPEDPNININNINDIYSSYNYHQFSMQQLQQLQQITMMQQYEQNTNFQNPHSIAAYQALEFAPPINHSNDTWKNLNHLKPQQRMLQLMHQQQYIQQMANQAAIAMAYFIEQQKNRMDELQLTHQQQKQNQNNQNIHRQKVASMSYINNNIRAQNNNNLMNPMELQSKQRLDTMDDAALTSGDLPPSIVGEGNILNDNQPGNDNNFYEFNDVNQKTHVIDINQNGQVGLVPPVNPMEMPNEHIIGAQPNMRKIDSLPQEIPDLPFANNSQDEPYDDQYYQ